MGLLERGGGLNRERGLTRAFTAMLQNHYILGNRRNREIGALE